MKYVYLHIYTSRTRARPDGTTSIEWPHCGAATADSHGERPGAQYPSVGARHCPLQLIFGVLRCVNRCSYRSRGQHVHEANWRVYKSRHAYGVTAGATGRQTIHIGGSAPILEMHTRGSRATSHSEHDDHERIRLSQK